ncbi:MAG: transposase, partial [Candidatus Methanomethylicaceae archaeon]
ELREHGVIKDTFTFVDSSALRSRIDTWKARDRVVEKELNNKTVGEDTRDPDARFGCKGKNKVWLGYKKHVAVCMSSRMITRIECTRANVADVKVVEQLVTRPTVVFGDKGYCSEEVERRLEERGCSSAIIKRDNMRAKDKEVDRWKTRLHMPYESIVTQLPKVTRWVGLQKNRFICIAYAFAYNIKRLVRLGVEGLRIFSSYPACQG